MEGLLNVQFDLHNSIKKGLANFKKSPKERITKEYLEARLENLERYWLSFQGNNAKLYEISKPDILAGTSYVLKEIYDVTEEEYLLYKSLMKTCFNQFSTPEGKTPSVKIDGKLGETLCPLVRLPKITIPTFSGSYAEWTTFRDMFVSLVHNNNALENVHKLHYLKSHITGEAEQLIRHAPITSANYSQCWSLLEQRYNNKKYLANCIFKRLFGIKRLNSESASGLKDLIDTTMDCLNALKNIGIDVSTWDIIIIQIVIFKLDPETRKQWELHISCSVDLNELPTLCQFKSFVESRFRALEFVDYKKPSVQHSSGIGSRPKTFVAMNVSRIRCEYCSENHKLCFCKRFAGEDISKRRDFAAKNSICFNCLGGNHMVLQCKKTGSCKICNKRHHTLLHQDFPHEVTSSTAMESVGSTSSSTSAPPIVSCLSTHGISSRSQVLLATALVNTETAAGEKHILRVLLDQGSQACFITEAAVQLLRLKKSPASGIITGLGGDQALSSKYTVTIKLKSRINGNAEIHTTAYVLKTITALLPERKLHKIDWTELKNLSLADPQFGTPKGIDMLLGANIYSKILEKGIKKNKNGNLIAQKTSLGWILSGTVSPHLSQNKEDVKKIAVMHAQIPETDMLKQFWELEEEKYRTKKLWTEEEKRCEKIFVTTTKRTEEGRYVVKLPFRVNQPGCVGGDSRQIAVTKFKSLEKRLMKNLQLKKSYTEVIHEYLQLGHMRPVTKDDKKRNEAVYLPHHAVVRNDKTTSKVRVVFNASSKNNLGVSLNDTLMVGPKLQSDLRHIVLRWRVQPIVLVADIIKMYRQVKVMEEDTMFQRIVWRDDPETELQDYELLTVTFGTASAPYLAVRALNQISLDEGKHFPLASSRVEQSFYMDDLMTGCTSVEEGVEIYKQMTALLSKGGFKLQKWNSNSKELLEILQNVEDQEKDMQKHLIENQDQKRNKVEMIDNMENIKDRKEIEIKTENTTKILGLTWDRNEDQFRYSVNLPNPASGPETKRSILSVIARLYDPLGWIAPSIIVAKLFIQKLWLAGVNWDEPISEELKNEWFTYRNELEQLTSIHVPRWLGTSTTDTKVELHGFCDASKFAYAAVVYLRIVEGAQDRHVSLLAAKTRVSPIKQVSIPRLELCGAVLLSRLLAEIADVLHIQKEHIRAWTDSTVVLAWLNSHPSRWKTLEMTLEMCTLLVCQIEACLNSRPMSVDSSDANDPRPLTSGHFLTGGPLIAVPEFDNYLESNVGSLTRWQFIQRMLQSFWPRCSQEYLSHLMNRYRWNSRVPEPKVGDIIVPCGDR